MSSTRDWRLFMDSPSHGARNMAIDHALFESVQSGASPALRLYRWDPPCLSLGRNQSARYDAGLVRAMGATLVRRPTGGLAVFHDRELTYAIAAPVAVIGRPRQAYTRISAAIASALRTLHVPAEVTQTRAPARPVHSYEPCFASPAAGEVVAGGEKLVGSAQRCERQTILQHGSLLLDGDQSILSELVPMTEAMSHRTQAHATVPVSVCAFLGRVPAWADLCDVIVREIATEFEVRLSPTRLTSAEEKRVHELEAMYAADAWTWRC